MTGRMWVEAWSPEYGTSYGIDVPEPEAAGGAGGQAQPLEEVPWAPVTPAVGVLPPLAFLDGVSRVDARVFLESDGALVAGLCGSVGVGAMKTNGTTRFGATKVHRALVFPPGRHAEMPFVSEVLDYESRQAKGPRPEDVRFALESLREEREGLLAAALADEGFIVIADGRLRRELPLSVIGYIKSQEGGYLDRGLQPIVPALGPGQRTPVFALLDQRHHHYSWYLRLAASPGGHPWAGVARCEVSASLPLPRAVELADLTAAHLPRFSSKPFWDTRSPQNLVPIATLERRLWHLQGDRQLVLRRIRSAVARAPEYAGV
ncbi:MAG: hypothetical protein QOH66_2283 [Actinomycetota bacterium]|jgi:hypothetical protein|nr:hypothetical protein [Actinomycetota bacterium]